MKIDSFFFFWDNCDEDRQLIKSFVELLEKMINPESSMATLFMLFDSTDTLLSKRRSGISKMGWLGRQRPYVTRKPRENI